MTKFILIAYIATNMHDSWVMEKFDTIEQCEDAKFALVMSAGARGYASVIECKEVGEEE